jgi:hypothetical protein
MATNIAGLVAGSRPDVRTAPEHVGPDASVQAGERKARLSTDDSKIRFRPSELSTTSLPIRRKASLSFRSQSGS